MKNEKIRKNNKKTQENGRKKRNVVRKYELEEKERGGNIRYRKSISIELITRLGGGR
jgi:hypothetical protein